MNPVFDLMSYLETHFLSQGHAYFLLEGSPFTCKPQSIVSDPTLGILLSHVGEGDQIAVLTPFVDITLRLPDFLVSGQ